MRQSLQGGTARTLTIETGVFDAMLETLAEMLGRGRSADMIDSTIVRAYAPLRCRHKNGTQVAEALGRSRGGLTTKLRASRNGKGRPLGFVVRQA